jgi:hypothetical protein
MIDISLDPVGIRLHLAPYDEWISEFRFTGTHWRVEAGYYPDGGDGQRRSAFSPPARTNPTTRVTLSLALDELLSASDPGDTVTVKMPLESDGEYIREPCSLSQLPEVFAQWLGHVDPDRTFDDPTLPPLRSPTAHAAVREQYDSFRDHARSAVARMSPPVEALVPLETSHRVLAVESIDMVRERGDPNRAAVWERYRDRLLPGECLGVHLTRERGEALRALRERGFDRGRAGIPPSGLTDDIRWNVFHAWVHAPDIGRWHGLRDCHAVILALPQAFTFVGQYAVPENEETYETDYVVRFAEYAAILADTPNALAESHTPDTLLGV